MLCCNAEHIFFFFTDPVQIRKLHQLGHGPHGYHRDGTSWVWLRCFPEGHHFHIPRRARTGQPLAGSGKWASGFGARFTLHQAACMHRDKGLSLLPNPTRCPDLRPCTQTQALVWPLAGSANGRAFWMRMMTESLFICASLVFVIFCRRAPSYRHQAVLTMNTLL